MKNLLAGVLLLNMPHIIAMEGSQKVNTHLELIVDDTATLISADLLPENWYRQLIENHLYTPDAGDAHDRPIIKLAIDKKNWPIIKESLLLMKALDEIPEYEATQIAHKKLEKWKLPLGDAAEILGCFDYLGVSKPLISAMARIVAESFEGLDCDLSVFSNEDIRKEINRYFYLLNDRYLESEPKGPVWLDDLISFKKINLKSMMSNKDIFKKSTQHIKLDLSKLQLDKIESLEKLQFFGPESQISIIDLDGNNLVALPRFYSGLIGLGLSNNALARLPEDFLSGQDRLECLDISRNKLKELPAGFGKQWKRLKQCGLVENKLEHITDDFLSCSAELEELGLGCNELKELPKKFGQAWKRLWALGLYGNKIEALSDDFLEENTL